MLCVFHGHYGKADLYLRSLNMKASVEYTIASCIFRNKFSLVDDMYLIIYHTTKCDLYLYIIIFFFQWRDTFTLLYINVLILCSIVVLRAIHS